MKTSSMQAGGATVNEYQIDHDGLIRRDGERWIPVGFNYWPPESGTDCWMDEHWSLEPFRRDFRQMADLGFNCVRMFLRWPEFQPEADKVNPIALERLAQVGQVGRDAGIRLIPTLFVGFMSGGLYPPPFVNPRNSASDMPYRPNQELREEYLADRNIFTDEACICAAELLAMSAARALAGCGAVMAYDLSNEINVWCNSIRGPTRALAIAWQRRMIAAIRRGHPGVWVMNGTNHTGIIAEMPWDVRVQSKVPMDLLSMHVYPVRTWNALPFASLQCYEADTLAPIHVAMARAYGPVMMQEFGVAVPVSGPRARDYLFQSTVGSYLAGGNGFLMWGWRDFETTRRPYRDNPFEKEICFLNTQGEMKEASRGFVDAVKFIRDLDGFTPPLPAIGIYLGESYWQGPHGTVANSIRCAWLSNALRRAHLAHAFTDTMDDSFAAIVIPGPRLCLDEIAALRAYVDRGGHVLLGDIGFTYWCDALKDLADLDLIDMASVSSNTLLKSKHAQFPVPAMAYVPAAAPRGAAVQATLGDPELPALLVSEGGRGRVATLFAPLGPELCEHPSRLLYDKILGPVFDAWGIAGEAKGLTPDVEARVVTNEQGESRLVLLNHATAPCIGTVRWTGNTRTFDIAAKGAVVLQSLVR